MSEYLGMAQVDQQRLIIDQQKREIDRLRATLSETEEQVLRMARLLLECRDALPAITKTAARLHNLDPTLADRIEEELKPWEVD